MAHGIGMYSNQPEGSPVEGASFERVSASDKEHAGPRRGLRVMSSVFHGDPPTGRDTPFASGPSKRPLLAAGLLNGVFSPACVLDYNFSNRDKSKQQ